jgi:hypothetical protein
MARDRRGRRDTRCIAVLRDKRGALPIEFPIIRRPRGQTVHIAIAHAEDGRDENGVVYFKVGRAELPSASHILVGDVFPPC